MKVPKTACWGPVCVCSPTLRNSVWWVQLTEYNRQAGFIIRGHRFLLRYVLKSPKVAEEFSHKLESHITCVCFTHGYLEFRNRILRMARRHYDQFLHKFPLDVWIN